ncbi:exosortase-associated protein EpsI, B-type [Piscinibacter defluvii]|uniref:exosortase-associated protein EpsI, B-type n=1 Tax=Piscinibacter defluvii TaxID=1796922 RepID=UPI000FDEE7B9|nr:exosortase-associated protein EpsI, B-type [Piscinibacter defluvii]
MNPTRRAWLACGAMALAAGSAAALTPRRRLATLLERPELERAVPRRFAGWQLDAAAGAALVNPRQQAALERLYQQMLARTYRNEAGERVMLALTYGADQRSDMALHYPEVCYPAQGFAVRSNRAGVLSVPGGHLAVRRLETALGTQRPEPVTYWTTIGEYHSLGSVERRLIELRYGLRGLIPDGYLVRVSSIGIDSAGEFARQDRFVAALLQALAPATRLALTGRTDA